jgi:glucose-specific phosphotransferase system IIA component
MSTTIGQTPEAPGAPTAGAVRVIAPVAGRTIRLDEVPDPIFAQAIVGPGVAIDPPRDVVDVVAPVSGRLLKVFPHAFVVLSPEGVGVLVHLGIDTVELDGAGFTLRAAQGDQVVAGDVVVTYDVPAIEAAGRSPIVPVILLEQQAESLTLAVAEGGAVRAGEALLALSR